MFDEFFEKAHELRASGQPFASAVVVRAERPTSGKPGDRALVTLDGVMFGWIGGSCAQPTVIREALAAMEDGESRLIRLSPDPGSEELPDGVVQVPMTCFSGGTLDVFIEPHQPRPQLLIVGSLPVAQALAHLGKAMSYRVSAVDPDGGQAMAHADRVVRDVSEITGLVTPLTFVVVATHGEFDEAGLSAALSSDAPYVALVASRKRGHAVMENLRAEGVEDAALARVKFPAGLDIGAKRGDEIALSIMAEIVQALRGMEAVSWTEAESVVDEFPPDTAVDPICQMTVKTEGALHTLEHEGTTYYFCCAGCRATFQADPTAYLGSPA